MILLAGCRVCRLNRFFEGRDSWPLNVAVDVGGPIGFGHLRRCTAIALKAQLLGAQVNFHLGGDLASSRRLVEMSGFDCRKMCKMGAGTVILVDRVYNDVLRQPAAFMADIARWRGQGARVAVIEDEIRGLPPRAPLR